ncbi:chromosome segregation protein Spc25-domain-containing protein [Collybia nuda]|uniref:Kinetochore protein SPC25 n=1 Tax=Collybia nuda TaxID=64659 RepID=A0A9P5YDH5_9AGAR|nr:chromosome segregation protein Spc25-domain-containing protein [Collybia nuda]
MTHVLRFPQVDLASVLANQNPRIDLRLEVYENSTRNFLKAVANYKNRAIATISDRRNNQTTEKKKIIERTQLVEAETNQCKLTEIELVADLEREKEEKRDAELSVAAFKRQLASLKERCSSIEVEIEQYRAITGNLRRERNKERSTLTMHASRVSPALEACEHRLSCIVEGIEREQLLIRFWLVDPSEPQREFSFVMDVSDTAYKVIMSSPPLPSLPILVDDLNITRDVYGFIKLVREAYEAHITVNL